MTENWRPTFEIEDKRIRSFYPRAHSRICRLSQLGVVYIFSQEYNLKLDLKLKLIIIVIFIDNAAYT